MNSHKWRFVFDYSALNTGPISNTLSISPQRAICLYNYGLWAKQASSPKYLNLKILAPPSDAPAINLGECISINPWSSMNSL